jgi:hypothetical protein
VNFPKEDAERLAKAAYTVDRGYLNRLEQDKLAYYFPRPLYEYDVYVSDSCLLKDVSEFPVRMGSPQDIEKDLASVLNIGVPPRFRLAFTGYNSASLAYSGVPFLTISDGHENISRWQINKITQQGDSVASLYDCLPLGSAIEGLAGQITAPIQYIRWGDYQVPYLVARGIILNRNGDIVAGYGIRFDADSRVVTPLYAVLPQVKDKAAAVLRILEVLAEVEPQWFQDRGYSQAWLESPEFAFSEELAIDAKITSVRKKASDIEQDLQADRLEIANRFGFLREILIATEGSAVPADRLSSKVRQALEFLGFTVSDIDPQIVGREDFWVRDRDFFALTEITVTKAKSPKYKEYADLLARMTTVLRRRGLVPDSEKLSGLLIVNHDIVNHPFKRPRIYSGEGEEIVTAAKEHRIGLLSTVELYRIAIAVKNGVMSPEDGRARIARYGRIEFEEDTKAG